jgi:D-alanine-D-alanine ligase
MAKKLRITAVVEEVNIPREDPKFEVRPKEPSMEHDVIRALRQLGHEVTVLGVFNQIEPIVEGIEKNPPDLVFNLAEQFANDRRHDKNLAGLLEMMEIPFTGTGSAGLLFCRDKALCKQLLSTWNIHVPGFRLFPLHRPVRLPRKLNFPLVVKPAYGDGSEGISNASLVKSEEELKERVQMMHERFAQDAIAEEYVEGREIYVGILGNRRLTVLPPYEIRFGNGEEEGPVLATYRVKWNKQYREKWAIQFGFADVPEKLWTRIADACRRTYRILQLNDYARIDLRITPDERVYILEANPNPDITQGEEVAEAARKAGIPYKRFIQRIVAHALTRQEK